MHNNSVTIADNGIGMSQREFRGFLRPNYSFKTETGSRGSKGVGATFQAYGFNHLEAATKNGSFSISGVLQNGRLWLDDASSVVPNPRIEHNLDTHPIFDTLDRGTVIRIFVKGENTRPKNLKWIGAKNAKEWLALLRTHTPIGGVYLLSQDPPKIAIVVTVIDEQGEETSVEIDSPKYLYPHLEASQVVDLREIISYTRKQVESGKPAHLPLKYKNLNGIWGEWNADQIFGGKNESPINPRFTKDDIETALKVDLKIYVFLAYSTDLWDAISNKYNIRKGERLLKGGLQIATKHMPQGPLLTIPLTNNIGFQNQAHVLVHIDNVEPDLGRKGFQPEITDLVERLAVSAVTAFRRRIDLLKPPGASKIFVDEIKIDEWIRQQEERLSTHPLSIKGKFLFSPKEELPIKSIPQSEQDVVALFNQIISSGVIRGLEILGTSQFKQYDGLYRINMESPFDKYIYDEDSNPLGIEPDKFQGAKQLRSTTKILEYKYSLDGLIEEIFTDVKSLNDIELVVVWEMGNKWRESFTITSLLDPDHAQYRVFHGATHQLNHTNINKTAVQIICLEDLLNYLNDRKNEIVRQRERYLDE